MPKYYVGCGPQQWITSADSAESAALSLLDELLAAHVWIYDDPQLTARQRREHLVLETLLHMAAQVCVSQRGFGRCEAGRFDTADLLDRWDRLMTAVGALLVAAGLSPRRVLPKARGCGSARPPQPR